MCAAPPPQLRFVESLSSQIGDAYDELLCDAARRGHRSVLVSHIPLCSAVPLARALLRFLAPFSSRSDAFTDEALAKLAAAFHHALSERLRRAATANALEIVEFDEGAHLCQLATKANAHALGLRSMPSLLASRLRSKASSGGGGASDTFRAPIDSPFWRDGHHPSAATHVLLAERVAAALANGVHAQS